MPIDKLTPRYLNKDDDFLIVKSVEMVDALNVHVGNNEDGNSDVLKNSRGNSAISIAIGSELPAGSNIVVGSGLNVEKSEIVFAVYNSNGSHSLYHYATSTDQVRLVYRDSVLGFTPMCFVKFDFIVKENGDTITYFTDGITDPKKINITKALLGTGYPYKSAGVYNYTDEEKLVCITTAKQPPLAPPTVAFTSVPNEDNFVYDEFFQFAYQYVYEDGEVSAISPYSDIAVNAYQLLDGFVSDATKDILNAINVTVNHSRADVSKIRLLARSADVTGFFVADEIDNLRTSTTETITFTNSKLRSYIAQAEQNKMYDNVPQKANSQAISGNRLVYGGYTEFYDNVDPSVTITELNNEKGQSVYISVNPTTASTVYYNPSGSVITSKFNVVVGDTINSTSFPSEVFMDFQLSSLISILPGSEGAIDFTDDDAATDISLGDIKLDITKQFTLPAYDGLTTGSPDVYAVFINNIIGNYTVPITEGEATLQPSGWVHNLKGNATINISLDAVNYGTTQISFLVKVTAVSIETTSGYDVATGAPMSSSEFISLTLDPTLLATAYTTRFLQFRAYKNYNSRQYYTPSDRTFKAGQQHKFGIVYYDKFNRSGAVNEIGAKEISWYSQRPADGRGPASLQFRLSHNPPSWARKWQLLYSPFTSYNYCLQHSVSEAFAADKDDTIYVSMNTLEGKSYSYIDFKNAKVEYVFGEGDKVRLVKYETGTLPGGDNVYVDYEFDVVGYEYYNAADFPVTTTVSDDRKSGWFLKLKNNADAGGFTKTEVIGDTDLWNKNTVVEIYRPIKQADINIYREISEVYDVVNVSGTYRHKGDRDYSYTWASGTSNITVNNGFATTSLDIRTGDLITISITILGILTSYEVRVGTIKRVGAGVTFSVANANVVGQLGTSVPPNGGYSLANISNLTQAVIETFNGDVYYRLRQMNVVTSYTSTPLMTTTFEDTFVEDNSITDFADSKFTSLGRPNAPAPTAGQVYRKSTITYSEPYVLDSQVLSLSSFNLAQANFVDFSPVYGGIQYIVDGGDSITVLQERKCSVAPINRNLIEYIGGGAGVTVSTNFIGAQSFYAGDYGVGKHPESVVNFFGRVYFADVNTGKVIRLGPDGITPISEEGVDSYIQTKLADAIKIGDSNFKFVGAMDPERGEYIISFQKRLSPGTYSDETIAFDVKGGVWRTRYSFIPESGIYVDNVMITFKNGAAWEHTDASTRNTFYGNAGVSQVKVVSSQNNSMVKVYEAISIEGDAAWNFSVETKEQSTDTVTSMDKREGAYYSSVPTAISSTSNIVPLGKVSSVVAITGGYRVTFSSDVYNLSFPLNGTISVSTGGGNFGSVTTAISSISDRNVIDFVGSYVPVVGTVIAVNSNSFIDGDKIRGPYAMFTFTNTSTSPVEAYAFNAYFNRSMLHNELVN